MIARRSAFLSLYPLLVLGFALVLGTACDVDSTVGYDDGGGALSGAVTCRADAPITLCDDSPCAVENLFDAPLGAVTLAADDADIFFLTSSVSIARRPIDGGAVVELAAADSTLIRMTSDATHVYWTELDGNVRGVAKAGGPRFDAGYVFGNPSDITLDEAHLYWILPAFGQIAMARKPSGEATHISGQDNPRAITTDATHVYWINAGSGADAGQLMRARRGDLTSVEVVLSGLDAPVAITVSDDAVYWASETVVSKLPKGESTPQTVATGFIEVKDIRVYGDTLYGVGMDGLWKVRASGGEWQPLERRGMSGMALSCSGVYATGWFESALVRYGP